MWDSGLMTGRIGYYCTGSGQGLLRLGPRRLANRLRLKDAHQRHSQTFRRRPLTKPKPALDFGDGTSLFRPIAAIGAPARLSWKLCRYRAMPEADRHLTAPHVRREGRQARPRIILLIATSRSA